MKIVLSLLSLAAAWASASASADPTTAADASALSTERVTPAEPAWGRIYLRRGLAAIQYFRDGYGGPMPNREVELYFPRRDEDRLGCELLPPDELDAIRAANGSLALVVDRGVCPFETKSRLAERMGAAALVVVSQDESATAPVAIVAKGEIAIATVMVRQSAGDMLRRVAQRERVFARLIPIVCDKNRTKSYDCKARSAAEMRYIDEQPARSGVVTAPATNATLGDFLAARYGSVVPTGALRLPAPLVPIDGCPELGAGELTGRVAVFSAMGGACSTLDRVSSAQRAGATMALLAVGELTTAMQHPTVEESWHAYNITIASAAISSATLAQLVALADKAAADVAVRLDVRNSIADAWDEVRKLSVKTAWPSRTDRRERLLKRVLDSFSLDDGQLLELKHNYLTVAGGSGAAWDHVVAPDRARGAAAEAADKVEVAVAAAGV